MAKTEAGDKVSSQYQRITELSVITHQRNVQRLMLDALDRSDIPGSLRSQLPRLTVLAENSSRDFLQISNNFLRLYTEAEGLGVLDASIFQTGVAFDRTHFQQRMLGAIDYSYRRKVAQTSPRTQADYDVIFSQIIKNASKDFTTHSLRPGRDGVTRIHEVSRIYSGWARNPNSGACDFCLMLATRKDYRTKSSAGFDAHRSCKCSAEPVTDGWAPSSENLDAYSRWVDKQEELNASGGWKSTRDRLHSKKDKPSGEDLTIKDIKERLSGV